MTTTTTTTSTTTTELAVRAAGLVKAFGDVRAVDGIDIDVRRGEIYGVLGPNGAGKTTMLRMLATLLPIDAGRAEIFGVDVARRPHVVRQLVGVTGQYASSTSCSRPARTCGCSPGCTACPRTGRGRSPTTCATPTRRPRC